MKKTYLNPELLVVKIATHQMLASSPETLGLGEEGSADDAEGRFDDWNED